MNERRKAQRYDMSLPISIRALPPQDGSECVGKTRNISTQGVYLTMESCVSNGMTVDLTVVLPSEKAENSSVLVRAKGTVIRVEDRSTQLGIAVSLAKYEIIRKPANGS